MEVMKNKTDSIAVFQYIALRSLITCAYAKYLHYCGAGARHCG